MLEVSASGFHAWRQRPLSARARADAELTERIRAIHAASHATCGAPRVHADLAAAGVHVARKRVARRMRTAGLRGASRRRDGRTTVRAPADVPALDRVQRDFSTPAPDRLWVADITCVPTVCRRASCIWP